MIRFILAVALAFGAPSTSWSAEEPTPGTTDYRIRYFTYDRDEVYVLQGTFDTATTIILDPTDEITSVQTGLSKAWQIELLDSKNVVVVKPTEEKGDTNLTMISKLGRVYSFVLTAVAAESLDSKEQIFRAHFRYPDAADLELKRRELAAAEAAERERQERLALEAEQQARWETAEAEERARADARAAEEAAERAKALEHQRALQLKEADREAQLAVLREQQALEYTRLREERERVEAARAAAEAERAAEVARKREEERFQSKTLLFDDGSPGAIVAASASTPTGERRRRRSTDELFLGEAYEASFPTSAASILPKQDRLVAQGTIIQAILETAVNSDLPGNTRAIVSEDVYSFDGSNLVIPKGSRLIGRYRSGLRLGQSRILAVWTRLIRPDGASISLGSPATDDLGVAGITGDVDTHFGAKFGSAALISIMSGLAVYGANEVQDESGREAAEDVGDDFTHNSENAFERYLNLPPTIRVDQGSRVSVQVARDLYF